MPSFFNFERNDEQFVAQMSGKNKNRASIIATSTKLRLWLFWILVFVAFLDLVDFVISCTQGKPELREGFNLLIPLMVFFQVDSQVKALKLTQQNEEQRTLDS